MLWGKKHKTNYNRKSDISYPIVTNKFRLTQVNPTARLTLFCWAEDSLNSSFSSEKMLCFWLHKNYNVSQGILNVYSMHIYYWLQNLLEAPSNLREIGHTQQLGFWYLFCPTVQRVLFVFQFISPVISNSQDHSWHFSLRVVTHYISSHRLIMLQYCIYSVKAMPSPLHVTYIQIHYSNKSVIRCP
jgi:hypothetical protein